MRCEVPEFKRCCFCFPLRYGLLVWGIINLIAAVYYNVLRIIKMHNIVNHIIDNGDIVEESIFLSISIVDFLLDILFIYAAITKKEKLLKYFLYGNSFLGVIVILYLLYAVIYSTYIFYGATQVLGWTTVKSYVWKAFTEITKAAFIIASQFFALLLLWSEIKKLERNNQPVKFVNNAAEAKCTMEDRDLEENNKDEQQEESTEELVEIIEEKSEIGATKL